MTSSFNIPILTSEIKSENLEQIVNKIAKLEKVSDSFKYEARQELYEKQLQEINIRNLAKDVYRILAEENISKNQTLKRITKTFGDLSKREIKEMMRKNKDVGFDWYHEM